MVDKGHFEEGWDLMVVVLMDCYTFIFIIGILLIIICLLFIPYKVHAVETVDSSLKIYDYGELLTDEEEVYLKGLIDEYIEKYDMDLVIVTKKDYYGDMKRYAQDFYDYNTFGTN
mgnify:CR=1 FL=1